MATDFNKEFIKFKELILRNNPQADIDLIKKAYDFDLMMNGGHITGSPKALASLRSNPD